MYPRTGALKYKTGRDEYTIRSFVEILHGHFRTTPFAYSHRQGLPDGVIVASADATAVSVKNYISRVLVSLSSF